MADIDVGSTVAAYAASNMLATARALPAAPADCAAAAANQPAYGAAAEAIAIAAEGSGVVD
ncbi:hypothetical protein OSJ04_25365 [Mycobacterium ulcerans]